MPAKIWYNGFMHNMTDLQLVTFVNGVKKHIAKGITFINGEKKVLWQTGNFAINSWTLQALQYPNNMAIPVGMYADGTRVLYSVGDYVSRNNVANISVPYQENCVKNGGVYSWDCVSHSETNESFVNGFVTQRSTRTTSGVFVSYVTTLNKTNVSTSDLSVSINETTDGGVITGGTYCKNGSDWISIVPEAGKYSVYKGQTVLCGVLATGYSGTTKPAIPVCTNLSTGYVLMSCAYQAVSGGAITYGIKRIKTSDGSVTDIVAGLDKEVTSIMVDGGNILYTSGNKLVKTSSAGGTVYGKYVADSGPIVLIGRISDNYYCGASTNPPGANNLISGKLVIHIVRRTGMTLREIQNTDILAKVIKTAPYISNNKYLCFGTYHANTSTSTGNPGLGSSYHVVSWTNVSSVEYRVNRIQGY